MDGLGNYTVSPELGGTFFVKHESKSLCGSYPNEHAFKMDLQKHDWKILHESIKEVVDVVRQVYVGNYFVKNREYQNDVLHKITSDFHHITTMTPVEIGKSLKYMIDYLPLFARTSQNKYNTAINKDVRIITEYYKRYLERFETYENSFLTA